MPPDLLTQKATNPASWIAVAPHEAAHGNWRLFDCTGSAASPVEEPLAAVAARLPRRTAICVIAPLTRCIVLATDLPPLRGAKLQQALAGVLEDRLTGNGGPQHYAAAPMEKGRIREAAVCDASWLKQCLEILAAAGLHVTQVVPEASLISNGTAWWGQWQADQPPAWLLRTANGETVRAAPSWVDALLPPEDSGARKTWQWLADPAIDAPPPAGNVKPTSLSVAALLGRATSSGWDLQQFAFKPADGAARFMAWFANVTAQRSGRFALAALLALILINVLGLNLYAMKQQREIDARHTEMERIVAQALPGAPRLVEPALQLEAAWQRTQGAGNAGAALLLNLFAQIGNATSLTSLDISASTLRATFADAAALERSAAACLRATMRESLQRAGVRCVREGDRLVLDYARESAALAKG